MPESLEDTKKRLRSQYLGKGGIHGMGLRKSQNAVCVYVERKPADGILAEEIEREAAPYKVIFVEESPPTVT